MVNLKLILSPLQVEVLLETANSYNKQINKRQDKTTALLRFQSAREYAEATYPEKLYLIDVVSHSSHFRLLIK